MTIMIIIALILLGIYFTLMILSVIFDFMEKVEKIIYCLYFIEVLLLITIGITWCVERI